MISALNAPLGEFTVGWLLISAFVGGLLGAAFKLIGEVILPKWLDGGELNRTELRRLLGQVNVAAADLSARLRSVADQGVAQGWLARENYERLRAGQGFLQAPAKEGGYYALSTTYAVLRLLASLELVRRSSRLADLCQSHAFSKKLEPLLRAMNSLRSTALVPAEDTRRDAVRLTRHVQASIGDFLIVSSESAGRLLNFREFSEVYAQDGTVRKWCEIIESYFENLSTDLNEDRRLIRLAAVEYWLLTHLAETRYSGLRAFGPDYGRRRELISGLQPMVREAVFGMPVQIS